MSFHSSSDDDDTGLDDTAIHSDDEDEATELPQSETIKLRWAIELWDCYDDLSNYTGGGIDFLEKFVKDFVKERGHIEKRYASELRALIKKYTPKSSDKAEKGKIFDEYTHLEAYKEVRITLFQADI